MGARTPELRLGIGDDCAILRPRAGEEIVVTTDFCLEYRHFRRDWHPPASVGHRTLARGLSDLAAMGARPLAAFLSLAVPRTLAADSAWLQGFLDGLLRLAEQARVPLAGGDTAEAPGPELLADIVLLGAVPSGRARRRDGVRPGDRLFVTGMLGGAAAELRGLASANASASGAAGKKTASQPAAEGRPTPNTDPAGAHPQLFPEPRLATGQALLRRNLATAAIDVSDGLSTDLAHLCATSGVAAEVFAAHLPIHPLASALGPQQALALALHGGEDYELLFAAGPKTRVPGSLGGVPVTEIGRFAAPGRGRPTLALIDAQNRRRTLKPGGWEHLR